MRFGTQTETLKTKEGCAQICSNIWPKRIGRSILTLFVIVTLVFCLLRLMPVEGYFANYEKMTEAQIQAGLQSMGLLDPLPVQIGRFWWNATPRRPRREPYL